MKVSDNGAEEKLIIADASDQKIASSRLLSFDLLLSYAVLSITINHLQWTPVMKIPNIIFRSLLSPAMSIFITISAYLFAEKYARMNGRNWFSKNNMRELLGKFFPSVIVFLLLKFIVIVGGGRTDMKNFLIDILGERICDRRRISDCYVSSTDNHFSFSVSRCKILSDFRRCFRIVIEYFI